MDEKMKKYKLSLNAPMEKLKSTYNDIRLWLAIGQLCATFSSDVLCKDKIKCRRTVIEALSPLGDEKDAMLQLMPKVIAARVATAMKMK